MPSLQSRGTQGVSKEKVDPPGLRMRRRGGTEEAGDDGDSTVSVLMCGWGSSKDLNGD